MRLTCLYKCQCMQDEGSFEINERRNNEDISDYMHLIQLTLGDDHRERNPFCMAIGVEYLKIPIKEDKGIGEA